MRCPSCNYDNTQVKDSRPVEGNTKIRRRRFCPKCEARFTTFETLQQKSLVVLKFSGLREPFDRTKIEQSMAVALAKRGKTRDEINDSVSRLVQEIEAENMQEISTREIGVRVLKELRGMDKLAFVRYAAVHRKLEAAQELANLVYGMRASGSRTE